MGCTNSKHAEDEPADREIDLKAHNGPGSKSETTRSRRLSYSIEAEARQQQLQQLQQQPPGDATTLVVTASDASVEGKGASTRGRRLSYVTNDKDLAAKIKAEYSMYEQDDGSLQQQAAQSLGSGTPASKPRQVAVQVACMSRAGREPGYKKTNQDNCFAFEKYISEDQSMFGAMDGHGPQGHLVSGFVKQHLPLLLVNHLTDGTTKLQEALTSGFLEVDAALAASKINCEFSGSTCSLAHLEGRTLTTAWVGDSRVVLGRSTRCGGWQAIDLSHDHKPATAEEKARILRSQGRVERLVDEMGQPMGPYRVWLQYAWIPGLAMSRALGDQLAHTVGVSSEPQHTRVELTPADQLLVLASDGVWEFISSQEAIELVGAADSTEEGCRLLVEEAYQRWLNEEEGVVDDITAVVVHLLHSNQQ